MSALAAARPSTLPGPRGVRFQHATKSHKGSFERRSATSAPAMRVNPAKGCKEVDVGAAAYTVSNGKTTRASVKGDHRAPARQLWRRGSNFMSGSRDADHGRGKVPTKSVARVSTARCVRRTRSKDRPRRLKAEKREEGSPKTTRVVARRRQLRGSIVPHNHSN